MTRIVKVAIFLGCFFLFLIDQSFIATVSTKIQDELLQSYTYPLFITFHEMLPEPTPATTVTKLIAFAPTPTLIPTKVVQSNKTISEDELWNALLFYRKAHNIGQINRSETLCVYARSRARELIERLKTNPSDPLDEHGGFQRDADSGYVFTSTGFNNVGENLAYTPGFTTGVQIIEWGWNTSSGHRELMLSTEMTDACITGIHPIYVAEFGK